MIDKHFIEKYSNRYQYGDLLEEKGILKEMKVHGAFLDLGILCKIANWKSPRIIKRVKANSAVFVREITKSAFSSEGEQFKIEVLTLLSGVKYAVASAILYFRFPTEYTIIDFRAWWTLQKAGYLKEDYPQEIQYKHWEEYLNICRHITSQAKCTLRDLDKALWQYSKEYQKNKTY